MLSQWYPQALYMSSQSYITEAIHSFLFMFYSPSNGDGPMMNTPSCFHLWLPCELLMLTHSTGCSQHYLALPVINCMYSQSMTLYRSASSQLNHPVLVLLFTRPTCVSPQILIFGGYMELTQYIAVVFLGNFIVNSLSVGYLVYSQFWKKCRLLETIFTQYVSKKQCP